MNELQITTNDFHAQHCLRFHIHISYKVFVSCEMWTIQWFYLQWHREPRLKITSAYNYILHWKHILAKRCMHTPYYSLLTIYEWYKVIQSSGHLPDELNVSSYTTINTVRHSIFVYKNSYETFCPPNIIHVSAISISFRFFRSSYCLTVVVIVLFSFKRKYSLNAHERCKSWYESEGMWYEYWAQIFNTWSKYWNKVVAYF